MKLEYLNALGRVAIVLVAATAFVGCLALTVGCGAQPTQAQQADTVKGAAEVVAEVEQCERDAKASDAGRAGYEECKAAVLADAGQ